MRIAETVEIAIEEITPEKYDFDVVIGSAGDCYLFPVS